MILTSRNQTWSNHWDAVEVNVFHRPESIGLVQRRGRDIAAEDADRLAETLGDLPLALDQAVSWLVATGMPVTDYVDVFDRHHRSLLAEGKPDDYPTTLATLVKLAFQRSWQDNPAVAQLMAMFAIFGPEPISLDLLRRGKAGAVPQPLGPTLRDPIALPRVVRELRRFGLVKIDARYRIQMHRLFQLMLRDELGEDQLRRSRADVHRLLGAANPGDPDQDDTHRAHGEIAPHVLPSGLIDAESEEARRVVLDQIRYLWVIGDYEGSRVLGEAAVRAWRARTDQADLGPDGELTIIASRHLANALLSIGRNDRARLLAEEVWRHLLENPAFGPDHEHTLATADVVAHCQRVAGEYDQALALDLDIADRCRRIFGNEDAEWLRCLGNLAVDRRMVGGFQGAYELDAIVVHILESTLTERDRRLLFAQSNLARDLYGLGRYPEALNLLERILPTYRRVMRDPKHPEILLAARTQSIALRKCGRYTAAMRLARESYQDCAARYGPGHQHSLAATMTYANTLRIAGDPVEARRLAVDAIARYRRVFGERHPLTLVALVNTAAIQRRLGDLTEARALDETAYTALVLTFGGTHGYTLCAASGLANDLALADEAENARRLSAETLAISRRSRNAGHPYTLLCAVNAALNAKADHLELAGALRALSDMLGPDHPEVIDARRGVRPECDIEPLPS